MNMKMLCPLHTVMPWIFRSSSAWMLFSNDLCRQQHASKIWVFVGRYWHARPQLAVSLPAGRDTLVSCNLMTCHLAKPTSAPIRQWQSQILTHTHACAHTLTQTHILDAQYYSVRDWSVGPLLLWITTTLPFFSIPTPTPTLTRSDQFAYLKYPVWGSFYCGDCGAYSTTQARKIGSR